MNQSVHFDKRRTIAIDHMRKKQFDKALSLFEELLEDGEDDSSLYYMAGQCCRYLWSDGHEFGHEIDDRNATNDL